MAHFSGAFEVADFLLRTGEYYSIRVELQQLGNTINGTYQAVNRTAGSLLFPNLPDLLFHHLRGEVQEGIVVFNITSSLQLLLIPVHNDSAKITLSIYERKAVFKDKIVLERLRQQGTSGSFIPPSLSNEEVIGYCKNKITGSFKNGNSFITRHHGEQRIVEQQGILFRQSSGKLLTFNSRPPGHNVLKDQHSLLKYLYENFKEDAQENGWRKEEEIWEFIKNYFQNKCMFRDLFYQKNEEQFSVFFKKEIIELFKEGKVYSCQDAGHNVCWCYDAIKSNWQSITQGKDPVVFSSELEFLDELFDMYKQNSLRGTHHTVSWKGLKNRVDKYKKTE